MRDTVVKGMDNNTKITEKAPSIFRRFHWLTSWLGPEGDGLTLLLAAFVLINVTWLLEKAGWEEGLPSLSGIALAALILGFFTVTKGVPPLISHLIAGFVGLGLCTVFGAAAVPGTGWISKLAGLVRELESWGSAIPATDVMREGHVEFIMLLVALFWTLGYLTAWFVLRHRQAWWIVLFGGMVVLIALNHLPEELYYHFLLYLASSVLLLVHVNMLKQQKDWGLSRVGYRPLLGITRLGFVVVIGLSSVLVAWKVPAVEAAPLEVVVDAAKGPFEFVQDQFSRLFAALPAKKPFLTLRWGNTLAFGGPPQLSDQVLFTVESKDPHYWRARVYDLYTIQGWRSSQGMQRLLTDELLQEAAGPQAMRAKVTHSIRLNAATDTLFLAGDPVQSSLPSIAITRFNQPEDVFSVRSGQELRLSQKYSVVSNVSVARPENLREAGTKYPSWVSENYLQLPANFPRRVRLRSEEVIGAAVTPYDKAIVIRDYLKAFPYNLNVKAPPTGRDGVDYFLFSQRTGYCDYYASAMVTMLRSVDVPARFVVGYATGEWDNVKKLYLVRELHYHSWVEVYFPNYGWVEFEPTPPDATEFTNQPPLNTTLPSADDDDATSGVLEDEPPEEVIVTDSGSIGWIMIGIILIIVSVLASIWYRSWGRLARLGYPAEIYSKMCRLGALARLAPEPQFTPLEYANRLATNLPEHATDIRFIATSYAKTCYGHRKFLIGDEKDGVNQAWRHLRKSLLVKIFQRNTL